MTDTKTCPVCGYRWGTTYAGQLECAVRTAMHPDAARDRAEDYRTRGCLMVVNTAPAAKPS